MTNYLNPSTLAILMSILFSDGKDDLKLPKLKFLYNDFSLALEELNWIYQTFNIPIYFNMERQETFPYYQSDNLSSVLADEMDSKLYNSCEEYYVELFNKNVKEDEDLFNNFKPKYLPDENVDVNEFALYEINVVLSITAEVKSQIQEFTNSYIELFQYNKLSGIQAYDFINQIQPSQESLKKIISRYGTEHIHLPIKEFGFQEHCRLFETLLFLQLRGLIIINNFKLDNSIFENIKIDFDCNINNIESFIKIEKNWHKFEAIKTNILTSETYYNSEEIKFQSAETLEYKFLKILITNPNEDIPLDVFRQELYPNYEDAELKEKLKDLTKELYKKFPSDRVFKIKTQGIFFKLCKNSP